MPLFNLFLFLVCLVVPGFWNGIVETEAQKWGIKLQRSLPRPHCIKRI